jgi:RNA polymerase sigma-70 factor (ECF subfamily)
MSIDIESQPGLEKLPGVPNFSNADEIAKLRRDLMSWALTRINDPQRAEEAVQDTLLAVVQHAHSFAGRSTFRTWAIGILKCKIVDYYRAKASEARVLVTTHLSPLDEHDFYEQATTDCRSPTNASTNPEFALERKRFLEALSTEIENMSSQQAKVFVMREVMGLESNAICAALNITPDNLWVLLHRARRTLQKALGSDWFAPV